MQQLEPDGPNIVKGPCIAGRHRHLVGLNWQKTAIRGKGHRVCTYTRVRILLRITCSNIMSVAHGFDIMRLRACSANIVLLNCQHVVRRSQSEVHLALEVSSHAGYGYGTAVQVEECLKCRWLRHKGSVGAVLSGNYSALIGYLTYQGQRSRLQGLPKSSKNRLAGA